MPINKDNGNNPYINRLAILKTIGCNRSIPKLAIIKDIHNNHITQMHTEKITVLIMGAIGCNCESPGSNTYIRNPIIAVIKVHVIDDNIRYNGYVSYCLY
ncbi:hypothetical protein VEIT17_09790 [Veillonella nakazawae]|uniref:Uncharacterized protein n=1 Tax=Veillonella nakazawae TaxID=2682456 RepID=A0ABM7HBY9_9FIRM|nr:hypothetical protein VEIT17_09790 [Veillonella nakazawae]